MDDIEPLPTYQTPEFIEKRLNKDLKMLAKCSGVNEDLLGPVEYQFKKPTCNNDLITLMIESRKVLEKTGVLFEDITLNQWAYFTTNHFGLDQ